MKLPIQHWLEDEPDLHEETLRERILNIAKEEYKAKETIVGEEVMRNFEKGIVLQTLDELWKNIFQRWITSARGFTYAAMVRKIRKTSTKKESFAMFTEMLDLLKTNVISVLSRIQSA